MVLINQRPGVYSSVEVSGSISGKNGGRTIGVTGLANTGTKGQVFVIRSLGQAISLFGAECGLVGLIEVLFLNGAGTITAVPAAVGESASIADYETAFTALMGREEVAVMVCDSTDGAVHEKMKQAILGGKTRTVNIELALWKLAEPLTILWPVLLR